MFLVRSVLELLDGSREIRSHFPSMFLFKKNYLFFWFLFLHQAPHLVHDLGKVHRACNIRYNYNFTKFNNFSPFMKMTRFDESYAD